MRDTGGGAVGAGSCAAAGACCFRRAGRSEFATSLLSFRTLRVLKEECNQEDDN